MNKISVGTISRTLVLFAALLNQFLTITGKNPLPFSDDEIYDGITMLLTTAASLWAGGKTTALQKPPSPATPIKKAINVPIRACDYN